MPHFKLFASLAFVLRFCGPCSVLKIAWGSIVNSNRGSTFTVCTNRVTYNVERICEEAEIMFLLPHLRTFVDYCYEVER